MKRWRVGALFLVSALVLVLLAERSPAGVERLYARGLYPVLSAALSCPTSVVPFSIAEISLFLLALVLLGRLAQAIRECRRDGWRRALASLGAFLLLGVGTLALAFVLLWGLNYRRLPLAATMGVEASPASSAELVAMSRELVLEANRLREGLGEDGLGAFAAPGGARAILRRTQAGFEAAAAGLSWLDGPGCLRPKPLLLSKALSWLGLTGIYSPFTGEPNVNVDAPEVELPFAASHEAAHARGFAREDEANFVGYLACRLHPDQDFKYAGLLAASVHAANALHGVDREAWALVEKDRSAGVLRDLRALRAWAARHEGPASRASERVNDAYLRVQGQADGVRSYGRMVDLLIAERRAAGPRAGR